MSGVEVVAEVELIEAPGFCSSPLRQLADVCGDALGLLIGAPPSAARLLLEIDVGQRLPAVVLDDEASGYCDFVHH